MPPEVDSNVTTTVEDYLESILAFTEEKGFARITDLHLSLGRSKPSITEMVSKLKELGFVEFEKRGTITLTSRGLKIARKIKNRHDILESLLILIGVNEEIAGEDCCNMEHNLSKETVEKLKGLLDFLKDKEQKDVLERYEDYLRKH